MIFSLFLRLLQLATSAAVLILSILAIKWQWVYHVPSETAYATFVGAAGCLTGLIGLAAFKAPLIAGLFITIFDLFTSIFFLAGGIAYAVALKGINCSKPDNVDTWGNKLIDGGCVWNYYNNSQYACGYDDWTFEPQATSRCRQVEANAAMMFIGAIVSLVLVVVSRHGKAAQAQNAA